MSAARKLAAARAWAARRNPDALPDELDEIARDVLADWEAEAAHEREVNGIEDTPCLESCDEGTGEGRYHGRI